LAADAAAYNRLVGDDERTTVTTLCAYCDVFHQSTVGEGTTFRLELPIARARRRNALPSISTCRRCEFR